MKGSVILLRKDEVLVRTEHVAPGVVRWSPEDRRLADILGEGFEIKENELLKVMNLLDQLHDRVDGGYKVSAQEIRHIKAILESYNE